MTAPIPAAAVPPPAPPPPAATPPPGAEAGGTSQASFQAQLHKPAEVQQPGVARRVDPSQKIEPMGQPIDAARVPATARNPTGAGGAGVEGGMNPFKRMDRVMQDFEKFMQNADKLDPDQRLGQLFQFQVQVQRASFDVQMVSKVVEHATSGARTILQTQA